MASMEPSEQEISQVIDFASLSPADDRFLVTQALKSNNRNVETVVMQYFDNPESVRALDEPDEWNTCSTVAVPTKVPDRLG